jgi:transcriptional regulator with XRE-family HTH domain
LTPTTKIKRKRFRNISGPIIRHLRYARGWTQSDLAAKLQLGGLDLDRADIAKLESQLRSIYDFELFLLAEILGVSAGELSPGPKKTKLSLPMLRKGYKEFR